LPPLSPQIGIIPYAGVDITAFELLKQRLLEEHDGRPPPPAVFAAGMLSSCVAQFVSYPLALVRTRMQVGLSFRIEGGLYSPCEDRSVYCHHGVCHLGNRHTS
jgi:Mitochondrial carrier protein